MATQYAFGQIITNGLVLALNAADRNSYPGSGTTWTDVSGNGNTGTLTNGPTFNSENGGNIVFDGTNDFVTGNISNLSVYTLCTFIKILTLKVGGGIIGGNNTGHVYIQMGGGSVWQFENAFTAYSPTVGQWTYVVGVQTASNAILYLNGTQVASAAGTSVLGTAYNLSKREVSSIYTNSQIGSAQIYNRALSATEIQQNYNAQKSRFNL